MINFIKKIVSLFLIGDESMTVEQELNADPSAFADYWDVWLKDESVFETLWETILRKWKT